MEEEKRNVVQGDTQVINTEEINEALARAEAEKENGGELRQRRAATQDEQVEEDFEDEAISEKESEETLEEKAEVKKEVKTKEKKTKTGGKKINVRLVCFIIILIAVITITISLVVLKIKSINNQYTYVEETTNVFEQVETKPDDTLKYVIGFEERYNINDIKVNQISVEDSGGVDYYLQIEGLANKDVQAKINASLKSYVGTGYYVREILEGNFSNILSVEIQKNTKVNGEYLYTFEGANYDLNTGEQIKFKDLFTNSAPIISILNEAYTKSMAWETIDRSYSNYNPDDWDISKKENFEYEDTIFKVKSIYEALGDNILFSLTENKIRIYNLREDFKNDSYNPAEIEIFKYNQYFTGYKRFVTAGSNIYDESFVNIHGLVPYFSVDNYNPTNYGSGKYEETDSYLMYFEYNLPSDSDLAKYINREQFVQEVNKALAPIIQKANNDPNNYYIIQGFSGGNVYDENSQRVEIENDYYISIYKYIFVTTIPKSEKVNLPKYFATVRNTPTASIEGLYLTSLGYRNVAGLDISNFNFDEQHKTDYYNLKFQYKGDSYLDIRKEFFKQFGS